MESTPSMRCLLKSWLVGVFTTFASPILLTVKLTAARSIITSSSIAHYIIVPTEVVTQLIRCVVSRHMYLCILFFEKKCCIYLSAPSSSLTKHLLLSCVLQFIIVVTVIMVAARKNNAAFISTACGVLISANLLIGGCNAWTTTSSNNHNHVRLPRSTTITTTSTLAVAVPSSATTISTFTTDNELSSSRSRQRQKLLQSALTHARKTDQKFGLSAPESIYAWSIVDELYAAIPEYNIVHYDVYIKPVLYSLGSIVLFSLIDIIN